MDRSSIRTVRSYVLRGGRTTPAQRRAIARCWPRFGVERRGTLDLDSLFGRHAPRILEIGFGMGDGLAAAAAASPARDFLGVEVYEPGIGRLLGELERRGLENVRVVREDAMALLEDGLPAGSIAEVWLFFPDPWPKKRHHKRRLVQPAFAERVRAVLEPGGRLRLATDCADYARHMLAVLEACPGLRNLAGHGATLPGPQGREASKFARRGAREGRAIHDLAFVRSD